MLESVICGDGSWSAVGSAIRIDAVMREFPLRASKTQCERYPADPASFIRQLTSPIREMLYCQP